MDSEIKPRLLTLKEAAKYSGINFNSLKLYVYRNEIPTVKIHKRRYILRDDLDDYIMANRTVSNVILMRRG